jgi:hypothetical protein
MKERMDGDEKVEGYIGIQLKKEKIQLHFYVIRD